MTVDLREATSADRERIATVHRAAIEELGPAAYDERQVAAWQRGVDPDMYPVGASDVRFLVAETDRVVGFAWLRFEADAYLDADVDGEVTATYVHPDAARSGVGTQLLAALERTARGAGLDSLGLWASLNAVGFYEERGYEAVAERELSYDDTSLPVREMVKPLEG